MRSLFALVWLAAAPALAQPGGMPDARRISGVPRADESVPKATITVRVVYGDVAAVAAPGTPVHLVRVAKGGQVELFTRPVESDGRAVFTGLPTGSDSAYYAAMLLGEDRLDSQPMSLPPEVGVRVMLAGRKRDAAGKPIGDPVDDQLEGTEVKVPPGEAWVAVQGEVAADAVVRVRDLAPGGQTVEGKLERQEQVAVARLKGLPVGAGHVYIAELESGGKRALAQPFMLSERAGALAVVQQGLRVGLQGGGQLEDDTVWFQLAFTIANYGGLPHDAGAAGLELPLPDGFSGAKVENEEQNQQIKLIPGKGLVWRGLIPPGESQVIVQLGIPVVSGRSHFSMRTPLGIARGSLFLEKVPGSIVNPASLPAPTAQHNPEDGKDYWALFDFSIPAGGTLDFEMLGLPARPMGERVVRYGAAAVVLALLIWALVVALRRPRIRAATPAARTGKKRELEQRREQLYGELVALELKRKQGAVDAGEFEEARRALMTRLVLVHRELDALGSPAEPVAKAQ